VFFLSVTIHRTIHECTVCKTYRNSLLVCLLWFVSRFQR